MTDRDSSGNGDGAGGDDRRQRLKQILAGGGVIVGGSSIPSTWSRAVVESVALPAHAQTTGISTGNFSGQGDAP